VLKTSNENRGVSMYLRRLEEVEEEKNKKRGYMMPAPKEGS
jgi:hypothetical protein